MGLFGKRKVELPTGAAASWGPPVVGAAMVRPRTTVELPRCVEVVGEYYYREHLNQIMMAEPTATGVDGQRYGVADLVAQLVPEPKNQYDRNATAVHVSGGLGGYLSKADALAFGREVKVAIRKAGSAAVAAKLRSAGGWYVLILEPAKVTPMSLFTIQGEIDRICDGCSQRESDEGVDCPGDIGAQEMKSGGWRLFSNDWSDDGEEAKWLANQLRKSGYKTSARDDADRSGYSVRVTAYQPVLPH